MNHLPRPKLIPYNSAKFDIRCYARHSYSGLDFRSYPERSGWPARSGTEWYAILQRGSEDFQGFLQTWLYFGVAQLFFRRPVAIEDLTITKPSTEDGSVEVYLDSTRLLAFVEEWLGDLEAFSRSDYMALSGDLAEARFVHEELRAASRAEDTEASSGQLVTFMDYLHGWPGGRDPRAPIMAEAQAALFDVIDGALARAREIHGGEKAEGEGGIGSLSSLAQTQGGSSYEGCALWSIMREDGWCPSELAMIFGSFSVAGIYFLSHVERPTKTHIHHQAAPNEPQNSGVELLVPKPVCSNRHCSIYQLDQNSYETKHTDDCPGCEEMQVQKDELLGILRRGQIPIVLAISENDNEKTQQSIKLQPYDASTPYLAISHVWADGLGNLARNGIPRCQMLRLSAFARATMPSGGDVYFWLDTLCCPPDAMNCPTEQGTALDLMRDTYANARTVLVIDKWLGAQHLCTDAIVDALFKVICSPWTRRLWTLQEGALAQKLLINCADGFFDVDRVIEMLMQRREVELLNVQTDILHRWYTIRSFKDLAAIELFHALYPSLAFRTTSVLADEPLCLATLFKLPVAAIAAQSTHEARMLTFWSMFTELPAEIMDHYEARLQTPGFRWAPRSFMSDDETLFPYSNTIMRHGNWPPAVRTDKGLNVTARGYYVHVKNLPLAAPIFVRHPEEFWAQCTFSFDLDAIEPLNLGEPSASQTAAAALAFSPQKSHQAQEIALVYHSNGHLEAWKSAKRDGSRITGSVASITAFQDGRIVARRFGLFALSPIPQGNATVAALEDALTAAIDAGADVDDIVMADRSNGCMLAGVLRKLPQTQTWLLD